MQKNELVPYLTPYTKNNSKRIKDLKAKSNIGKLLEENVKVDLCDLGFDNGFFDLTPKAQTSIWDYINTDFFVLQCGKSTMEYYSAIKKR